MAQPITKALVGNIHARTWFSNVVISLLLLGIQFFICIYVLIVFLETPKPARKGRWPYVVFIFLALALSAIPISMDAAFMFFSLFESVSPGDFLDRQSAGFKYYWMRVPGQTVPTRLLMFLGDGLLLYRCYIVCNGSRWLIALPALLFLAILPVGIITMTSLSSNTWILSVVLMSVALNVLITAIISTRLLKARRQFTRALPESSKGIGARYTGVVAILIEAATPLTVFGLAYGIAAAVVTGMKPDMNRLRTEVAIYFLEVLYYSFTAISPQLIIFRVTTGRSWTADFSTTYPSVRPTNTSGQLSSSLVFSNKGGPGQSQKETYFDHELESRSGEGIAKAY